MSREHRLAAIMFTDIQGYTKLMQEDEHKAIEFRARHREIFQAATSNNAGEIIQYYGDGTLSIFESCVDAVRCAIQMQNQFQSDPAMPVRVGIHLGDIVLTEDDIIGNSVNIASRIESLGVPGSIIISHKVYDEIQNKPEFQVEKLGKFHFKNDKEPRVIYAVTGEKLVVPKKHQLHGKLEYDKQGKRKKILFWIFACLAILFSVFWGVDLDKMIFNQKIKRLAVLPLNDRIPLTSDEDYIINGLHEELITKMSKVGINVTSYSTMSYYREHPTTPEVIGNELKVDGVVEGSLHQIMEGSSDRTEDTIMFRVQIIEVDDQIYISEPYEARAQFGSIMSIFPKLVNAIANQIQHPVSEEAQTYLNRNLVVDPEAYKLYLRARSEINKGSSEDLLRAVEYLNQSLELDSSFVDAHISLIESYLYLGFFSDDPTYELEKFREHVDLAIEKDPFFAGDHHKNAMVKIFEDWDWLGANEEMKKAMKAYPRSWQPFDTYCQLMWAMGDMDQSIKAGKKAVRKAPNEHFAHCDLAWAYYFDKNYEMAKRQVDRATQILPDCDQHNGLNLLLDITTKNRIGQSLIPTIDRIKREVLPWKYPADSIELKGDPANPADSIELKGDPANPVYNISLLGYAYALDGNREMAMEILEELESNDLPGADKIYIALGDYDKALDMLETGVSNRSFFQRFAIKEMDWYDPLRSDPRFERILTRMGLADDQLN